MKVVPVKNLSNGNLDLVDLKEKAEKHKDRLGAFMVRLSFVSVRAVLMIPRSDHLPLDLRCIRARCSRGLQDYS